MQVENARKTSAWYGNTHDAGAAYLGTSLGDGKSFASMSPTSGEWYRRQARGRKLRMGVVRFQNETLTSSMMLAFDDILEKEWNRCTSND